MKAKLGKMNQVGNVKHGAYVLLLRNFLKEAATIPDAVYDYVLVKGECLTWKGDTGPSEEQPLLYLGKKMAWEKDLKGNKEYTLKDYSYGQCKIVQVGTDAHLSLLPEKGKLTDDSQLKPLKKVFKKMKPKVFFEVVGDLTEVEAAPRGDQESNDSVPLVEQLGKELQHYHVLLNKVQEQLKAKPEQREKLLVQQNKILRRLKHLCTNWKEVIVPQADQMLQEEPAQTWQKIYQRWQTYFDKRQAAKEGSSNDIKGIQAEEERLYTKALTDLELFFGNMEKGISLDPAVIETNLTNLEGHYNKWKTFATGKQGIKHQAALEEMCQILEEAKKDWSGVKPILEAYHKLSGELEQALDDFDVERAEEKQQLLEDLINKL